MSAIKTPFGIITMRPPTEAEAIAFEDKLRASRRPRATAEQVTGSAYDNGVQELIACAISPDAKTLDVEDGWLSQCPGIFDLMKDELRRLGGYHQQLVDCPEAIDATTQANFGKKALGYEYAGVRIVARRMTYAEYNAMLANRDGGNFWSLLAAQGKACLLSHQDVADDKAQQRLLAGRPFLAMDLGLKLYDVAMGRAEQQAGKSESAPNDKTTISTSPPVTSSAPATAGAGGASSAATA